MSWLSNIVSAVQNFFSSKPQVQSAWPVTPTPNYPSVNKSTPSYTQQIVRQSYPQSAPARQSIPTPQPARGVDVVGPTYTSGGGNQGGGGGQSVPSTSSAPPPYVPPPSPELPIQKVISNIAQNVAPKLAAVSPNLSSTVGKAGQAIKAAGTGVSNLLGNQLQLVPGGLGAYLANVGGTQDIISEYQRRGILPSLPNAQKEFSERSAQAGPELQSQADRTRGIVGDILTGLINPQWGKSNIQTPSLWDILVGKANMTALPTPPTSPGVSGQILPSAASTSQGQVLPTAAKTGAPQAQAKSLIPSPAPSTRGGMVPSAVNAATLPANMANLTAQNVNPSLAKSITPEAIQSIGQLLLQSLLGNQSGLTGLNPGIAQALWGAPTSSMPFGGYEASASVPNQERIKQPANLPPIPGPVAQG